MSEVSEEVATQIAKNCRRRQPHSHLRPPPRGTPSNISARTLYFQKLLAYISVADSMGLSSFKFVLYAPKHASFCTWVRLAVQGHPMSMILVPIESACQFVLVCHCDYRPILHRFSDTAIYWRKIADFSHPLSFGAPAPMFPLQFRSEETRVIWLSYSEDPMFVAWVILTQCQPATDRRTNRGTDGRINYYS